MVVNGEFEMSVGRNVHQADAVSGSRGEDGLMTLSNNGAVLLSEGVGTVDEPSVHGWRTADPRNESEVIRSVMRPVGQNHRAQVDVVVGCGRSIDYDATKDAIPCLNVEVGVPPRGAVLGSPPPVGSCLARSGRALGDGRNAVIRVGVVLANSVEVDGGAVVLH